MKQTKILKLIEDAKRAASMEHASFSIMWPGPKDGLPVDESGVTQFIRERTQLYMETWVIGPLKQIEELLGKGEA